MESQISIHMKLSSFLVHLPVATHHFFKRIHLITKLVFKCAQVKAWLADKDAEALRCQKLLVEEEEASMRR